MQTLYPIKDWQAKFEKWVANTCRPNTYTNYRRALDEFFSRFPERKRLEDFSRLDMNDYRIWRLKDGVSPTTVNLELRIVKVFWNWLREVHELPLSQMKFKELKELERKRKFLRDEELEAFWGCMNTPTMKLLFLMGLTTGMRGCEMVSLKWDAVDLKGRVVHVVADVAKSSRERILPLRDDVVAMLEAIPNKKGHVFAQFYGRQDAMQKALRHRLRKAGIFEVGLHNLRHTFGTNLLRSKVDVKTVQHLLGHSDMKTTCGYLEPMTADESRKSLDALGHIYQAEEAPAEA